jgi:hypothetical protein
MRWLPMPMPPSVTALLNKARAGRGGQKGEYSRAQEFIAALHHYASLPLAVRLEVIRAHAARNAD